MSLKKINIDKKKQKALKEMKKLSPINKYSDNIPLNYNDDITISDLLDLYTMFLVPNSPSNSFSSICEHKSKRNTVKTIFRVFFELLDTPVSCLNNINLRLWSIDYAKKRGIKNVTMNRYIASLRGMLTWGYKNKILTEHKLHDYTELPVTSICNIGQRRFLSKEEIKRLIKTLNKREVEKRKKRTSYNLRLKAMGQHPLPEYLPISEGYVDYVYPMIMVSLLTGARKGSVRGLKWKDIDFKSDTIIFQGENSKCGNTIIVPITCKLSKILLRWKPQNNIADTPSCMSQFVFQRDDGLLPVDSSCPRCWKHLLKKAKIENFRWHDMRHTYASHLIQNGVDIATLKNLMGHSHIATTALYLHVSPQHMKESVKILDKIVP